MQKMIYLYDFTYINIAGPHSETGSACFYSMPGVNNEHPMEFFRILRVAYAKPTGESVTGKEVQPVK